MWQQPCWRLIPGTEPWILISSFLSIRISVLLCLFSRRLSSFSCSKCLTSPNGSWCWLVGCWLRVAVQMLIRMLHTRHGRSGEASCQAWDSLLLLRISRKPVALLCAFQAQRLLASARHNCCQSLVQAPPAFCMSRIASYEWTEYEIYTTHEVRMFCV